MGPGRLVEWFTARPEAQAVLQTGFGGCPVSEQNLRKWKQGVHRDWLKQQERRESARQASEDAEPSPRLP